MLSQFLPIEDVLQINKEKLGVLQFVSSVFSSVDLTHRTAGLSCSVDAQVCQWDKPGKSVYTHTRAMLAHKLSQHGPINIQCVKRIKSS